MYCLSVWQWLGSLLTVCALMVKTNSTFELILDTDIFFHLNANFTLILTKRL